MTFSIMESEKLSFSCPACQIVLRVPAELAGVHGPCPHCHTDIVAPIPASDIPAALAAAAPPAVPEFGPRPVEPFPDVAATRLQPLSAILPSYAHPLSPQLQASPAGVAASESIVWPPPTGSDHQGTDDPEPEPAAPNLGISEFDDCDPEPSGSELGRELDPEPTLGGSDTPVDAQILAEVSPIDPLPEAEASPLEEPPGRQSIRQRFDILQRPGLKYAVALLALGLFSIAAIKLVGRGFDQVGEQASIASLPPSSTTPPPSAIGAVADETGLSYTSQPSSKAIPVNPAPNSQFRPEPALSTDRIEEFMGDATGDGSRPPSGSPGAGAPGLPGIGTEKPVEDPAPAAEPEESTFTRAQTLLEKALAADSVDALAKMVLAPERVLPIMRAHYGDRSPAQTISSIIYEASEQFPDSGYSNHTFFISTSEQPIRFPVAIEDTADGPKLDWESFIELHDDRLGKFLAKPQTRSQTFHVILERRHYFDTDVPKLGSKDCFRISTPIPGSEGYAFVDKDSSTGRECELFEWDRLCFPIVTLRWTTPPDGKPYLEITDLVQTSWRALGDDSQVAN